MGGLKGARGAPQPLALTSSTIMSLLPCWPFSRALHPRFPPPLPPLPHTPPHALTYVLRTGLSHRYSDRPEVKAWQQSTREYAKQHGYVNTMLGRRRNLRPAINSSDRWVVARAERAAINTPIQGSAADVAAAAMLAIDRDKWLNEHGWKMLLQVR